RNQPALRDEGVEACLRALEAGARRIGGVELADRKSETPSGDARGAVARADGAAEHLAASREADPRAIERRREVLQANGARRPRTRLARQALGERERGGRRRGRRGCWRRLLVAAGAGRKSNQ